jgi:GT2 family glycosyltransferase
MQMETCQLAVIMIGRNEGERLDRALRSIDARPLIYVDSGSTDGSVERAAALGALVVALDPAEGFTAARARNAGLARLAELGTPPPFVQMIDGDCELQPGWIDSALAAMAADDGLAVVFGRRRERFPDASAYNWMCDVEWAVPPGPADAFGGDALIRHAAVAQVQGYRATMIAGEEPELAIRLRAAGWRLACIDAEMTLHDAAITGFGQWWRRTARGGHAFAELASLHPRSRYRRNVLRAVFWGGLLPLVFVGGHLSGTKAGAQAGGLAVLLTVAQLIRLVAREGLRFPIRQAINAATFLLIGKYAETLGIVRFHCQRLTGRRARLIEYKRPDPA